MERARPGRRGFFRLTRPRRLVGPLSKVTDFRAKSAVPKGMAPVRLLGLETGSGSLSGRILAERRIDRAVFSLAPRAVALWTPGFPFRAHQAPRPTGRTEKASKHSRSKNGASPSLAS
jgi:hypothetical protein